MKSSDVNDFVDFGFGSSEYKIKDKFLAIFN